MMEIERQDDALNTVREKLTENINLDIIENLL